MPPERYAIELSKPQRQMIAHALASSQQLSRGNIVEALMQAINMHNISQLPENKAFLHWLLATDTFEEDEANADHSETAR